VIGGDELGDLGPVVVGETADSVVQPGPRVDFLREVAMLLCVPAEHDRVRVPFDQRLVVEEEAGGCDLARDDAFGPLEEVLVVGGGPALRGAERDDGGRLGGAARAALPLRVVRRRGRHVAHVDRRQ
jgi:hypothetical protein